LLKENELKQKCILDFLITYLIVCLDSDDCDISSVVSEVLASIEVDLKTCKLEIVVQKRCFETWFLGNSRIVRRNPNTNFREYLNHYDVRMSNPENMLKINGFNKSNSQFHAKYLIKMLLERDMNYSKSRPDSVCSDSYINESIKRVDETDDLSSFKNFIELMRRLKSYCV